MKSKRKNIILFSFDDCIAFHLFREAFGEVLKIENINSILNSSILFSSAYCQNPICGPSRASFMTGRASHDLGIFDHSVDNFSIIEPKDVWSYKLKEAGYFCSSGGKVHHGYGALKPQLHKALYSDAPKRFGNDFRLPENVDRKHYGGIGGGWSTTDPKDDGIFYDAKSADSAIDFINNYDGSAPFYREIGFFSPHGPRFTPARFKDMYELSNFQMPESWKDGFTPHKYTDTVWLQTPQLVKGNLTWWAENVRNYFSAMSHADYHIGRIWQALKNSKHADNTIVVFLTDHGFLLGARNRFYKSTIWEMSARVPFFIHDPEYSEGRVDDTPVALLDVGPTVLDYADCPPMENCLGRSLRQRVAGGSGDPDRIVPTVRYDNISARVGPFRIACFEDGSTQFFDVERDVWNHQDLGCDHPMYEEALEALVRVGQDYGWSPPIE